MSPQSSPRPVMDVSAPRPAQPTTVAGAIAVQPAPISMEMPKSAPSSATSQPKMARVQAQSNPVHQASSSAPVGVITIAVLVMMLLSAAAVIVYVTSQTA